MRLILLRHAKSSRPEGIDDHDRPLSGRGRRDSEEIGGYMASEGLVPNEVLTSTARRAWATWHLARPALDGAIDCRCRHRIYDASAEMLLDTIRETQSEIETLLVVGHNPGLHELAVSLAGSGDVSVRERLGRKLPTAGLVVLDFVGTEWRDVFPGTGELERFVTPRMLKA